MTDPALTAAVAARISAGREKIARMEAFLVAAEKVLLMLPVEIVECHAHAVSDWVQLCNLDREQVSDCMRALSSENPIGKWNRKSSHEGGMIDYEATINGIRVLIYAAPPPGSCRVVEEIVHVPAHDVTTRRVLCK